MKSEVFSDITPCNLVNIDVSEEFYKFISDVTRIFVPPAQILPTGNVVPIRYMASCYKTVIIKLGFIEILFLVPAAWNEL